MKRFSPWLALCAVGCHKSDHHSPTIDVLGSYFPAWMICLLIGLALTVVFHILLTALRFNEHLHPAPIVYFCMMVVFTMATWLLFFQN